MTVAWRWVVALLSMTVGLVLTWAVYRTVPLLAPEPPIAPTTPSAPAHEEPGASTLWLLAIGVSRYASSDLDLRFADADAKSVADAVKTAADDHMYAGVQTLVLTNDEVTRESMLSSMERFLGQAGPEDVAVLFVAGHGVRDLASGSYYFLPHPATADNLVGQGLRMSDFDETLRVLRRNVRAVVVMLDTCHAGALGIPSGRIVSADEMAAQVSVGEGFFLLAATKPGEESKEQVDLGHGAFTYALLEAMRGPADSDGNGSLSVSELFGYVARRVPELTLGHQHPYHKMEGTDVVLLPVEVSAAQGAPTRRPTEAGAPETPVSASASSNTIGVMQFQNLRADAEYDWISRALRTAFNTELSKVHALRVYSPELIDRTARGRGFDQLYTARQLGIGRLLTGSFHVTDHTLRVDAHIIDASTGVNEASDSVEGDLGTFFDLQKHLVLSMLRRLRVHVSAEEGESIQTRTNTDVDAYRLLLEAEGVGESEAQPVTPSAASPSPASSPEPVSRGLPDLIATAYADEVPPAGDAEVRQLLEDYRSAVEKKDVDGVAKLYVEFSQRQREALSGYLKSASELRVELTDVVSTPHAGGVAASFTRRDHFVDRESGRPVHLEVRLTKILVREGGKWKISGGK